MLIFPVNFWSDEDDEEDDEEDDKEKVKAKDLPGAHWFLIAIDYTNDTLFCMDSYQ